MVLNRAVQFKELPCSSGVNIKYSNEGYGIQKRMTLLRYKICLKLYGYP